MVKLKNWGREETLEHENRPYVWRHGNDDTLTLRVEAAEYNPVRKNKPPFYSVVLRRKYSDNPIARIGTRENKSDAYDLAIKWAGNHPNPKQAKKEPF